MANKDIFDDPFNEGTLTKLEIFEKYFEEWLPTFVMGNINKPIQVFDLFAGIGYDKIGQEGSPIRILKIINKYRNLIENSGKKICIYLNDSNLSKYEALSLNTQIKISEFTLDSIVQLKITNLTFIECLSLYNSELKKGCNLLFIDQNGFKEVNEEIFQHLIKLEITEFIFFLSSSHIHRFANIPEIQKIHPKFDFEKIKTSSRKKGFYVKNCG
jgi:three-Cys-motif partner protein